jgi:ADP-heptose:LPS heptosyltransferase
VILLVKKILVIRRNGFGDLIATLPMLQALRKKYPEAQITLIGSFRGRKLIPYIDIIDQYYLIPKGNKYLQIIRTCLPLRKQKYDIAISAKAGPQKLMNFALWLVGAKQRIAYTDNHWSSKLINNPYPYTRHENQHTALRILQLVKPSHKKIPKNLYPRINSNQSQIKNHQKEVALLLKPDHFNIFISISNNRTTSTLKNSNYSSTLNDLKSQYNNLHVVIFHLSHDIDKAKALKNQLHCASETITNKGMGHFLCLLNEVDTLLIGDGGLMHLAASLNKPQLVLFAKTPIAEWGPISDNAQILEDDTDVNNISKKEIVDRLKRLAKPNKLLPKPFTF